MASDDELEEFSSEWKGIPATIIYINILNTEAAKVALDATCRLMRQYLRTSSSQFIAVCIYGIENSHNSVFGIKTVEEVFPLNFPTLDAYESIDKINIALYSQSKELILSDVLWHSRKMFANCKKQLLSRNVIILSRLNVPPIQTDHKPSFKEAVDLSDSNIEIKLINVSPTEEVDQFYKDFLINANKSQEIELPKAVWDHVEIEQLMQQNCNRHLAVARLAFEIGDGLSIGVGVYSLLKGKTQQKTTALDGESHTILTTVNKTLKVRVDNDEDMEIDGEQIPKAVPILKSEILYHQVFGGEKIEFTDNEMKKLKNPFGPAKLKLLGFKPAHIMCKEKWIFKPCYFLFPNESIIEGSIVAFKALHQACIEMNVVGICVLCTRVNSRPTIVALSPCKQPLGLNVDVGFDVIHVPFLEHMRNLSNVQDEEDITVEIEETKKNVLKDILCELKFDYQPIFENPKLQSRYRALEIIALGNDEIEPFTDTTKPDPDKFNNVQDALFNEVFGPFEVGTAKRVAQSSNGPNKRVKAEEFDVSVFQERLKNQQLNNYTVSQLKDILKSKHISDLPALTGLKKNDLVNLVYKHWK